MMFTIPVVAWMTLGLSCRTPDVGSCDATSKERLLNMVITDEVEFRGAFILDVLTYLDRKVVERSGGEPLNLMYSRGWSTNWPTRLVTYHATNVTVGAVLREAMRQTGLRTEVIAEATVVGSPETLHRIRSLPPLSSPKDQALAARLEQRLEIWQGCQWHLYDFAAYLKDVAGVTIDVTETDQALRLFLGYRADIPHMKLKSFLWWLAVLSDTQVTLVEDTVKFRTRKSNKEPKAKGEPAP